MPAEKTVIRSAFAMFDDHNNTLVQETQDPRISWPEGIGISVGSLNRAAPTTTFNNLPTYGSFFNPLQPYVDFGADPRNKIPYVMEYNFGVQQQLNSKHGLERGLCGISGASPLHTAACEYGFDAGSRSGEPPSAVSCVWRRFLI